MNLRICKLVLKHLHTMNQLDPECVTGFELPIDSTEVIEEGNVIHEVRVRAIISIHHREILDPFRCQVTSRPQVFAQLNFL